MDDRRFDSLVKLFASGSSRRTLLRSLLGLGAAAIVANEADARTARTRPTIPPPPPPGCPLPKQMCGGVCCDAGRCKDGHCCPNTTDVWCGNVCCASGVCTSDGECCPTGHHACGATCCPTGHACARDGAADICCDPATHAPCGLECCPSELQCCDGECCPSGSVCLTQLFPESAVIEEEVCCPESRACDNQCCDGTCFFDPGSEPFLPPPWPWPTASCCPATEGVTFCPGLRDFRAAGACCSGDTPHCCHDMDGRPVCITNEQCCTSEECVDVGMDGACASCDLTTFTCQSVNNGSLCPGTECGVCLNGHCTAEITLCDDCEQCSASLTCEPDCRPDGCFCQVCETCGDIGLCQSLCSPTQTCCFDVCFEGPGQTCCFNDDGCSACQSCQLGPGQVGTCVSACTIDKPKCCENQFASSCVSEETVCCSSDTDCHAIPTYCETRPDGDLLWRYHLCSSSFCTLTAHPCDQANNICERNTCGATTDCGVEQIPPGGTATDGVSICCDSDDDCAGLPRFCDDDDLFHYHLCGTYTCTPTAVQCDVGACSPLIGCQTAGP